jgi:hypothetical protein
MKVIKHFYCTQEKKVYEVGNTYTGKRTDISNYLEEIKQEEEKPKKRKK